MNERHPTAIEVILLNGQYKIYLFKSWKSARRYTEFLIINGLIKSYNFLRRNPNLNCINPNEFTFLPL